MRSKKGFGGKTKTKFDSRDKNKQMHNLIKTQARKAKMAKQSQTLNDKRLGRKNVNKYHVGSYTFGLIIFLFFIKLFNFYEYFFKSLKLGLYITNK